MMFFDFKVISSTLKIIKIYIKQLNVFISYKLRIDIPEFGAKRGHLTQMSEWPIEIHYIAIRPMRPLIDWLR